MIKLIKSTFYKEETVKKSLLHFISESPTLSFNQQCEFFEERFSQYQERQESVFVNSGSSANLAVIQALLNLGRLKHGDKVGFSAVTWSTNVMPLLQLGLVPIPIDVELATLNVSSRTLNETLQKHPDLKAVFITHLLGFCDDIEVIKKICSNYPLILIEDTCEALGSVYQGKKLGNFGLASTFSFYVGHHLSTIEGGMVCTDDQELATMLRIVRAHGWDRNLKLPHRQKIRNQHQINSTFYSRYTFYDLGFNLRPTEINGFLGTVATQYADEIVSKRQRHYKFLAKHLYTQSNPYIAINTSHMQVISNFAFPIVCHTTAIRDELVGRCNGQVEIRPIVGGNMILQPFFQKHSSTEASHCPNSTLIHETGLYFGNNPELTEEELQRLCEIFDYAQPIP